MYSLGLIILLITSIEAVIVPQELPSILSLVYSNIPPVKKGTDSRVGFGFRLGEHADFQVMFELGPQKDTRPIGMSSSSNSKRNVNQQDYVPVSEDPHDNEPMSWLKNWSKDMHKTKSQVLTSSPEFGSTASQIQTVPLISESALKQLQMLYKKQSSSHLDEFGFNNNSNNQVSSAVTAITETSAELNKTKAKISAELMDVELN